MKKILLLGMLITSLSMQAQIFGDKIENAPGTVNAFLTSYNTIPPIFSSDNKAYFLDYSSDEYNDFINVYNDELQQVRRFQINGLLNIYYCDTNNASWISSINELVVTQTLFNNDEEYEYLRYLTEEKETEEYYEHPIWDDSTSTIIGWEIDTITTTTTYDIGVEIVNESGSVLQSLYFETPRTNETCNLVKINDKFYFIVMGDDWAEPANPEWYAFTPGSCTGLKKVQAPAGLSVMPSLAKRHQSITIETDDESKNREVNIVDASGKSVWKQIIPAGQKSIRVNAAKLSKGLNVVNVDGEKEKSVKVIVN